MDFGIVNFNGIRGVLQKAQQLGCVVLVDDAHVFALRQQEAGQPELRAQRIAVGIHVGRENEALMLGALLAKQRVGFRRYHQADCGALRRSRRFFRIRAWYSAS